MRWSSDCERSFVIERPLIVGTIRFALLLSLHAKLRAIMVSFGPEWVVRLEATIHRSANSMFHHPNYLVALVAAIVTAQAAQGQSLSGREASPLLAGDLQDYGANSRYQLMPSDVWRHGANQNSRGPIHQGPHEHRYPPNNSRACIGCSWNGDWYGGGSPNLPAPRAPHGVTINGEYYY
jgi:hypothetical protein